MNNKNGYGAQMKMGNLQQQFVPDRLRQLRIALGYSTIDFSERIGVTRQALNQFETKRITPSYETILKIESVTGFPANYFYKPLTQTSEGPFLFRANATSLKKTKELSKFIIHRIEELNNYLSNYLDFTSVNVPSIEFDVSSSLDEIEDIAVAVRKYWGLGIGPISHVYRLLENNGVIISQLDKSLDKIDAFSQWRNGNPFILVGSKEFSASRLRLNAMHEFAHLLLHTDEEYEERANKDKEFYQKLESQAYRFAGAFLLPQESFLNEVYSTSLSHLIDLKQRWGVSLAAIVKRCKDLEIITDSRYETLIRQIKKYGKNEPLDDVMEKEKPTAFKQAITLIINHEVKTKQEILSDIRMPNSLLEQLLGVEQEFFTEKNLENNILPMKLKSNS